MQKFLLLLFLVFTFTSQTFANTKEEQRIWFGLFAKKNITTNYDLWAEAQLRHDESHQTMNQTLNRFGILRKLNDNHEVGFLFGFIQTGLTKEYRPTLQHIWKSSNFSVRNRLEGRDIENEDANSLRYRSLARWSLPLSTKYDLVLWDEPFANLTHETWTGNRFLERNRAFVGTRVKFEQISFEVGYMNQYIPRKNQDLSEHILTLYFFF